MAPLKDLYTDPTIKVLLMGDSGSGKTGALASLAEAGYNLNIIDYDNGTHILKHLLSPLATARVDVEVCIDEMRVMNGRVFPKEARAWQKGVSLLESWPGKGKITSWGKQDVLVIDSLTFAGTAAMNFHLNLNNRLAATPDWKDFKLPQDFIRRLLELLYSDAVKCNVVVITHVEYMAPPGFTLEEKKKQEVFRGYPTAIGGSIGPRIGRFFNSVLLARSDGGARNIWTNPRDNIELKTPAPGIIKDYYPLKTGLAQYFTDVKAKARIEALGEVS